MKLNVRFRKFGIFVYQKTDICPPLQKPGSQVSSFLFLLFFLSWMLAANDKTGEIYLKSKYFAVGFYVNNSYFLIIILNENYVKVNPYFPWIFLPWKFFFSWNKIAERNKKIESSQSELAEQPKYLECEVSELLGNCVWFDNWKDC